MHPLLDYLRRHTEANLALKDHSSISPLSLVNDTRKIVSHSVFVAEQGISCHALDYLTEADCELADLVIYQPPYQHLSRFDGQHHKFIALDNLTAHLGELALCFTQYQFNYPIVGVTGTNGKTSITHFIAQLSDNQISVLGTNGYGNPEKLKPIENTTPNAILTHDILCELSHDYNGVAMEVSSHALSLNRVKSVPFSIAIFSNLSQDHLDFHENMADYFSAKKQLFNYQSVHTSIINVDDPLGLELAIDCEKNGKEVIAIGQSEKAKKFKCYAHIQQLELSLSGMSATIKVAQNGEMTTHYFKTPVWGAFNVFNVLSAIFSVHLMQHTSLQALFLKAQIIKGVRGRIEAINLPQNKTVIVDYAHTPDALASTLKSIKAHFNDDESLFNQTKIYTIFGCGGDRDKKKRPLMAGVANDYSDFVIVTDDNPRTEDPNAIVEDILSADVETTRFKVIQPRENAIQSGLSLLSENDVLLIAGKGHEDYQIIGKEKQFFCDKQVVLNWLKEHQSL